MYLFSLFFGTSNTKNSNFRKFKSFFVLLVGGNKKEKVNSRYTFSPNTTFSKRINILIIRTKYTNEEREIVKELRPIDDTLFRTMAKGNIILVEHIVRLSLNRDDIKILSVNTQDDIHLFKDSHSVILDCLAVDSEGNLYNIEVQATNTGNLRKRARYISSAIDVKYTLEAGEKDYNKIKDQIVIFLMEDDIFDKGKQLYEFKRYDDQSKLSLDDGSRIIYINAKNKGRKELDNLMQSLISSDYKTMKDDVIRECAMYYKTSEIGEDEVCEAVREYAVKYAAKTLLDLVNKGAITLDYAIENSGLPKEEFLSIAETLGYKL